jgi:hypothetical protein
MIPVSLQIDIVAMLVLSVVKPKLVVVPRGTVCRCLCRGFGGIVPKIAVFHVPVAQQIRHIRINNPTDMLHLDIMLYGMMDAKADARRLREWSSTL